VAAAVVVAVEQALAVAAATPALARSTAKPA
jgi:hypothetical protein